MRHPSPFFIALALLLGTVLGPGFPAPLRAAGVTEIHLTDGTTVTGDFAVKKDGLFRRTESGGRLYRWADIDPASLPADVRDLKRRQVLATLAAAHALYLQERVTEATPLYQEVYAYRLYLTDADRTGDAFADLSYKMQGLVLLEGRYVTVAERQQARGLALDQGGRWRPAAEVAEDQAFRQAFQEAKESRDALAVLARLKDLLDKYPQSRHRPAAEALMAQLRQAVAAPPAPPRPAPPAVADDPPPRLDDYYYRLPGDVEKPEAIKLPDLKSRVYPDADPRNQYPYFAEDGATGYYRPKYWRDAAGNYHYVINGIAFQSHYPPPLVPFPR